ncbi:nucleolar RNA helicase 2-like isoform X1 [Clytia hemisphaerica]
MIFSLYGRSLTAFRIVRSSCYQLSRNFSKTFHQNISCSSKKQISFQPDQWNPCIINTSRLYSTNFENNDIHKDKESLETLKLKLRELATSQVLKHRARKDTVSSEKIRNQQKEDGDFSNFEISKKTTKKLKANGVEYLFPVQAETFAACHKGNDVIVQARTGTGKTLAFTLPILEILRDYEDEVFEKKRRMPMALVLAPTRELAMQIYKEFEKYKAKKISVSCFYGGAPYEQQEHEMREGIDVLVGTPGRIMDYLHKGKLNFSNLKHACLDEADRMMDMGFQESLDEILSSAYTNDNKPQTLLFSATVPPWVKDTAKKYMDKNYKTFDLIGKDINKSSTSVEHKAIKCSYYERAATIKDILQVYSGKHGKSIIFTSTKQEANELALSSVIKMDSQVLHGDIQQKQREITLQSFRDGKFNCLIATDVAARGLDIPEIDLVIQTEPPKDVDSYIHRAGRTGRAGRNGACIIFFKPGQEWGVQAVERKAGIQFTRIGPPQQEDIIRASAHDAVRCLDDISDEVLSIFAPSAKELIEKRDGNAEEALAAALAYISGVTEIVQRSLLSSQPGYTTYMMKQNLELRSNSLIWSTLRRYFDESFLGSIKGMRMCADKLGCVFDVPDSSISVLEDTWQGDKFATLEKLTELPELVEGVSSQYGGGSGGNFSRGGGRGGYGGGRGGGNNWNRNQNGNRSFGSNWSNNNNNNRNSQGGYGRKRPFENNGQSNFGGGYDKRQRR